MPVRYAPALFLEVLAFWFVLRWFLLARVIRLVGWLLVLMMAVGVLGTFGEHRYVWAAFFAGSAVLAWGLLRRWDQIRSCRRLLRLRVSPAWRSKSAAEVAALCERRIGLQVDAATPARLDGNQQSCVLALAGDGVWILEDESRVWLAQVGRVLACWDRAGLVAHVEDSHRSQRFELSWPRNGALVRGSMPAGAAADLLAGHLVADELAL